MSDDLDLSIFDTRTSANEGAWLDLRNPANLSEPLLRRGVPIRLKLLGRDSDVFKKISAKIQNFRFKEQSRGRNSSLTAEQLDTESISMLTACTIGWENIVVDGQELEFNADNVRNFYLRFTAFRDQADEFIGARENFMKAL